jgi:hypothetical protein
MSSSVIIEEALGLMASSKDYLELLESGRFSFQIDGRIDATWAERAAANTRQTIALLEELIRGLRQ